MKIIWSPLALERVNEIADYIAEDESSRRFPCSTGDCRHKCFEVVRRELDHTALLGAHVSRHQQLGNF
jgi:hypothetical protein